MELSSNKMETSNWKVSGMDEITEEDLLVLAKELAGNVWWDPLNNHYLDSPLDFKGFLSGVPDSSARRWPLEIPFKEIPLHMNFDRPNLYAFKGWVKAVFNWRLQIGK